MVCPRCIKGVREDLEKVGREVVTIQLGQVAVRSPATRIDRVTVQQILESEGFEVLEDHQRNVPGCHGTNRREILHSAFRTGIRGASKDFANFKKNYAKLSHN